MMLGTLLGIMLIRIPLTVLMLMLELLLQLVIVLSGMMKVLLVLLGIMMLGMLCSPSSIAPGNAIDSAADAYSPYSSYPIQLLEMILGRMLLQPMMLLVGILMGLLVVMLLVMLLKLLLGHQCGNLRERSGRMATANAYFLQNLAFQEKVILPT